MCEQKMLNWKKKFGFGKITEAESEESFKLRERKLQNQSKERKLCGKQYA